ncbi:MAG: molecular chaperone HtpG, partial [Oscillospiraceae bacterium]|nr:molecular chaperone HtpG [Oscillospiraceae bacterium]
QHDRQLKVIATALEKKIKNELSTLLKNDREKYETFFKAFGLQLKFGIYSSYGQNKDMLQDLLLFYTSAEKKYATLEEYVSRMKEDQKYIYYACGESVAKLDMMPQTELLKEKGYEILYLTEDVDEFVMRTLHSYADKEFKSANDGDLGLESDAEKEQTKQQAEDSKDMLQFVKETLADKVKDVKLTTRLKSHPVCLSAEGDISLEMEKVMNAMPTDQKIKAERVLEINANHPIFATMNALYATDKDKVKTYAEILYTQALLIEGMPVEDPVAYASAVCSLMV